MEVRVFINFVKRDIVVFIYGSNMVVFFLVVGLVKVLGI